MSERKVLFRTKISNMMRIFFLRLLNVAPHYNNSHTAYENRFSADEREDEVHIVFDVFSSRCEVGVWFGCGGMEMRPPNFSGAENVRMKDIMMMRCVCVCVWKMHTLMKIMVFSTSKECKSDVSLVYKTLRVLTIVLGPESE